MTPKKHGGLNRAVPSHEVGRCGLPDHDGYGAICLGCAIDLARDERSEREEQLENALRALVKHNDYFDKPGCWCSDITVSFPGQKHSEACDKTRKVLGIS